MKNIYLIFILLSCYCTHAQVGIGTNLPDDSAALDITSTTQGLLIPRMNLTQRNAILLPANGLTIYNTTSNQFQVNIGTPALPVWDTLVSTNTINQSVKYSNIDVTTDVNPNTAINLPVIGTLNWNDNSGLYVANTATNSIQVTQAGRYNIAVNVSLFNFTASQRDAPEMIIAINGTPVGSWSSTGYIRNNSPHDRSSLHLNETLNLAANDVVTVQIVRSSGGGQVRLRSAGTTNLLINKLK